MQSLLSLVTFISSDPDPVSVGVSGGGVTETGSGVGATSIGLKFKFYTPKIFFRYLLVTKVHHKFQEN